MRLIKFSVITIAALVAVVVGLPDREAPAWAETSVFDVSWEAGPDVWVSAKIETPVTQVGMTWTDRAPTYLAVRTLDGGEWGPWVSMSIESDHGPDPGTAEHERQVSGTDLLWVDPADGVQFLVRGTTPEDAQATVIDTTDRTKPLSRRFSDLLSPTVESAQGAPAQPQIHPRSEWDPSGSCEPKAEPAEVQVTHAFVHHTTGPNDYTDAAARVLSICLFHTGSRGWDDIGYNFLIDRFGEVWEGRAGGIDRGVQGAHTAGFNSYSTGIAFIGDHTSSAPTAAARSALVDLLAWKFGVHNVEPAKISTLVSKGSALWEEGKPVSLYPISGHRDGQATTCPGAACYNLLPTFRADVDALWSQTPLSTYQAPLVGDFDGDGSHEGAIFSTLDGRWRIAQPDGSIVTWTAPFSPISGWSHHPGDFDGDGKTDIAHYYAGNGTWWISRSTGTGFTTTKWSKEFTPATGWQHRTGDFDGDGKTDIAHYYGGNGTWWVSRSTGSGFSTTQWSNGFLPAVGWQHIVGDFNGDGRTDIAHYFKGNGKWWVSASGGSSFSTTHWATTTTYDHLSMMFSQDVDADNDDDLLFFDAYNGYLTRLAGGAGSFTVSSIDTPWRTTLGHLYAGPQDGDSTMVFYGQEFEWISLTDLDAGMDASSVSALPRP